MVYSVNAGQQFSLEGSSGEAFADKEGRARKVAMTAHEGSFKALT